MRDAQDQPEPSYMRRAVDRIPSMMAYWDAALRCRFANAAYRTWFGTDPETMIGMRIQDLLGPELFELNRGYIEGALQGQAQTFERVLPGPDGVARPSLTNYLPDIVEGRVQGFFAHVTEITHLKRIEEALRASEAFLDRTGRIARVGGWEFDMRSGQATWSDQLCRLLGMPVGFSPDQEEMTGNLPPASLKILSTAIQRAIDNKGSWDVEIPMVTAQGQKIWARHLGEPEFLGDQPVRLIGAIQDISEKVEHRAQLAKEQLLRSQLEKHAAELNALLTERSDMLDILAHEVRQPLHNASAALQSALAALVTANEAVASPRLVRAQNVMTQVMAGLDNTLAVAALLARSTPIEVGDMDMDTLVAVAIADMAQAGRPRIVVQRQTRMRTAAMDMSLMRLALRNLLSNALKYGQPSTSVVVTLADSEDPLGLVIDVASEGSPIPADMLPTLFQRGTRGRHHHGAPIGLGLGLYIVKRVMDLHGGRVELVRNEPGGVTIRLLLPAASA